MTNLEIGNLYFWIQHADRARRYLLPTAMVFVGKNILPEDTRAAVATDLWYFQDARSYCIFGPHDFSKPFEKEITGEEFAELPGEKLTSELFALPEGNLYQVVDCEGLAQAASECARCRAKSGHPS